MCINIINLFLCASVYIFVKFAIIISNVQFSQMLETPILRKMQVNRMKKYLKEKVK